MKRILAILLAVLMLAGTMPIYAQEAETECEHEYFNACDGVCMNCGEVTREATHELTHVPEVVATDCLHPGNIEYYECSKCGGYFTDAEGYEQINPWYVETSVDCVRPEDAADCDTVPCEVCGNEIYGNGEHDRIDSYLCQGGTCLKCGEQVTGYGCENDGPYCLDGHCVYCGEFVEGWGHENGAWAACIDGLCAYGCGLEYPATAEHNDADGNGICDVCYFCAGDHIFENGFDPCYGGTCSRCWAYFEGEHTYDVACDVDCNVCGETREVEHNVVHVPAVAGSCIETGNLEYWYCLSCGSVWLDEECTFPSNLKAVVLAGPSHPELLHFEAKEPTCFGDGNIEYWYCELCGRAFIDEYGFDFIKLEETVIPAAHTFANSCDVDCNVCGENREVEHNVIHVEAVKPTCKETGNIEYWYCDVCGSAWLDAECTLNTNIMAVITPIPGPVFEMIHVEAKDPTCTEDGNVEYWYCESCGDLYLDEEGTLPTTLEEVTVPALGHDLRGTGLCTEPTCTEDGICSNDMFCVRCEEWFENSTIIPALGHVYYIDEVIEEPTCTTSGLALQKCIRCDYSEYINTPPAHTFANSCDVDCNVCGETREVEHNVIHVEAVEPTCKETGNIEYWYCDVCGSAWLDAECIFPTNLKAVMLPGPYGKLTHVEAKDPTCTEDGNIEYWYCEYCGDHYLDEEGTLPTTLEEVTVPAAHTFANSCDVDCNVCGETREVEHTLVHVPAVEGTCIETGNIEYWYCEVCGSAWLDAECTLNTNLHAVVVIGASHPERYIVHVEAKAATCFEDGNIEYWYCDLCKCYFSHEYMRPHQEINVSETVIPAAHTFANPCDTYCVVCEEDVRDPAHTLTYVARVEPVDCQTPGNIEHWYCEVCDGYFADEKGINQYNPWYIPVTADCVRPEGAPDCATINCLVCGEEIYGYGEHDLGENFACQGGTCLKCGTEVSGYGCANYDTPACMDGVCYYCGGFVAGLGHENGAWAPCLKGECSYGCGLEYPATAEHDDEDGDGYCNVCWNHINHSFDNGFDPCYGGECTICWTYVAGEHEFDTEYTVDKAPTEEETGLKSRHCANCSEVTDVVEIPVIMRGDVNGDTRVTSRDLMALKKFLQSIKAESFNEFNADINGDGRINSRDTIALKNKMA